MNAVKKETNTPEDPNEQLEKDLAAANEGGEDEGIYENFEDYARQVKNAINA